MHYPPLLRCRRAMLAVDSGADAGPDCPACPGGPGADSAASGRDGRPYRRTALATPPPLAVVDVVTGAGAGLSKPGKILGRLLALVIIIIITKHFFTRGHNLQWVVPHTGGITDRVRPCPRPCRLRCEQSPRACAREGWHTCRRRLPARSPAAGRA